MTHAEITRRALPFAVRWHAWPGGWHWGDVVAVEHGRNNVPVAVIRTADGAPVRKLPKSIVPSESGVRP